MPFQSQIPQLYRWIESQYGTGYSYNPSFDASRVTPSEMGGRGTGALSASGGGSPWSRLPSVGSPSVQINPIDRNAPPDSPRATGRARIDPFRGGQVQPGGDPFLDPNGNAWNPDPGTLPGNRPAEFDPSAYGDISVPRPPSSGQPVVELPRMPRRSAAAGGGIGAGGGVGGGMFYPLPVSSGREPFVERGQIYVGNEYRPALKNTGPVQIDPSTGQPWDFSDIDFSDIPEGDGGGGSGTGAGGGRVGGGTGGGGGGSLAQILRSYPTLNTPAAIRALQGGADPRSMIGSAQFDSRAANLMLMGSQAYGGNPNDTAGTGDEGHTVFAPGHSARLDELGGFDVTHGGANPNMWPRPGQNELAAYGFPAGTPYTAENMGLYNAALSSWMGAQGGRNEAGGFTSGGFRTGPARAGAGAARTRAWTELITAGGRRQATRQSSQATGGV